MLIGLNNKMVKIANVNQISEGLIEVTIENKKRKTRCPICNKFTNLIHDN